MLSDLIDIYDGKQFEKICKKLLSLKHTDQNFQQVPAGNKGDYGIEGYTFDAFAYQCYAPERVYSTKELYEHQRDKLTTDINKFIKNEKELDKLINGKKFKRWIFLTTEYNAKELISHAAKKTKEVKESGLIHIDNDFSILVKSVDEYLYQEIELYKRQIRKFLNVEHPAIDESEVIDWLKANTPLANNLTRKLKKLKLSDDRLNSSINLYVRMYLMMRKMLSEVAHKNTEVFESIIQVFNAKTLAIEMKSNSGEIETFGDINGDLTELAEILKEQLEDFIKPSTRENLKSCKVADWLIECSMDFK